MMRLAGRAHNDVIGTSSCLLNYRSKIIKPVFPTSPCHDIVASGKDEENIDVPAYLGKKTVTYTTHGRPQFRVRLPLNRPIGRIGNFSRNPRSKCITLIVNATAGD